MAPRPLVDPEPAGVKNRISTAEGGGPTSGDNLVSIFKWKIKICNIKIQISNITQLIENIQVVLFF
jgi:hypothetical protein